VDTDFLLRLIEFTRATGLLGHHVFSETESAQWDFNPYRSASLYIMMITLLPSRHETMN